MSLMIGFPVAPCKLQLVALQLPQYDGGPGTLTSSSRSQFQVHTFVTSLLQRIILGFAFNLFSRHHLDGKEYPLCHAFLTTTRLLHYQSI